MLKFYVESDLKLHHLRQCPVGKHLNGFAGWLRLAGYKQRPAQLTLRGAAHLGHWASAHGVPTERVDDVVSDAFARHLPTFACPHAFQGRDDYHAAGARRFSEYLRTVGIIASIAVDPEPVPRGADSLLEPDPIADAYLALHRQQRLDAGTRSTALGREVLSRPYNTHS